MADKIVVLNAGKIEQVGSPLDLYLKPANLFVAEFLGSPRINSFRTRIDAIENGAAIMTLPSGGSFSMPLDGAASSVGDAVTLAVRPEHFSDAIGAAATITARVELVEHLGSETLVSMKTADDTPITLKAEGVRRVQFGEEMILGLLPARCQLFGEDGKVLVHNRIS
jgi:multiple sugar transport system ATP-binding protein